MKNIRLRIIPDYIWKKLFGKTYTVTLYMKSGNKIILKNFTKFDVTSEKGVITNISYTYISISGENPLVYLDTSQIEAIT